jgi:Tfp pilus assembly protein PilX
MPASFDIRHSTFVIPRRRRGGFALLITITLLAFLVLLLVSLASLTRVETQVASNNQSISQARQNALMALNIALGQLQKHTGPDQRVTAPADIASAADGTRLAAAGSAQNTVSVNGTRNGLGSVQAGTRWWTGVWGRSGSSYSTPGLSPYEATPSPVLLNWLVSGNEDRAFTIGPDGLVATSTADTTSAGNTAPFVPGAPVNWSAAGLDPASPASWTAGSAYSNLEIKAAGQKAVLLVGPHTAGTAPSSGEAAVERYVVAPLQNITLPASAVPGAGTSGTVTAGRYGWWVGDEGVKASYALADPHAGQIDPSSSDEARLRLMTASRSGIELVTGWQDYPAVNDTAADAKLSRVLDLQQVSLLTPSVTTSAQRSAFHDFTRLSSGLLTNTLTGGLRKDLTYSFESSTNWNASPLKGTGIIPSPWSPDWGSSGLAPKWDWLYSFYNTNPAVSSPSLAVRPETATEVGIFPVITQLRMIFFTETGLFTSPKSLPAATTFNLPMRCNVVLVLANPYNATLTVAAGDMEALIKNNVAGTAGIRIHAAMGAGKGTELARFGVLRATGSTETEGLLDTVKFTIPALSIPAGETVTLAVQGNGQSINASANAPDAEPANTVALSVRTASNPITSTDYFSAGTNLNFSTPATPTGAGIALFQSAADLSLTLRRPSGDIYQRIEHFRINKDNQVNAFTGNVLGSAHLKFIAPAQRTMNWDPPGDPNLKSTFTYYVYGRPYIDYNPRSSRITHPNVYSDTVGNTYALLSPPSYGAGVIRYAAGGNAAADQFSAFTDSLHPAQWIEDFNDDRRSGALQGVLYDFPRRSAGQLPVMSLAQFQHAALATNDQTVNGTTSFLSGYTVGNSYHHPHVARGSAVQSRANTFSKAPSGNTRYFDLPYLLNTALWEGYFLSGIRQSGADFEPLNPRYSLDNTATAATARSADSAAALTVKGSFNINSTSKDAWVAFLGGLNGLRVNDDPESSGVPFPRSLWQPLPSQSVAGTFQTPGTGDDAYAGYRRLTAAEIDALAAEIVKRVRARGPFVSLSHFINRTLVPAGADFNPAVNDASSAGALAASAIPQGRGLAGPLQAAIDASGINTFAGSGSVTADAADENGDRVLFNGEIANSLAHKSDSNNTRAAYYADKQFDAPHTNWDMTAVAPPGPNGRTSTGIAGWLLQGDVLQALGPALSARSDTFVIRTYGETLNPATGEVIGRAWCEALVQRTAGYVDGSDATVTPAAGTPAATFGRAYKVVGFRWLSPEDI